MRIYLDTCCVNRPFDALTQPRVQKEAAAVVQIIEQVVHGTVEWVSSDALADELDRISDPIRRAAVLRTLRHASEIVKTTPTARARSGELIRLGFSCADAVHIACAEEAGVEIVITTDDRLQRCAIRNAAKLRVKIANPTVWLRTLHVEGRSHDEG